MKLRILTCLIVFAFSSNAQNNFFTPDTSTNQLVINGYGGVASTGIPQNFMNKFIFPGFIDQSLKDEASQNLKDNNLFGGELTTDFHLYMKPGSLSKNEFWGIGFGSNLEGNLNFKKDLFNLIFYGNQPYAGETLNLNETSFNALSYSYIDFTIGKTFKNANETNSFWIDLGVVMGHNYSKFDLPTASVFTESDGDYLEITIEDGEISFSDTLSSSLIKGFGGKVNLNYSYRSDNTKLIVQAKNIGGISWNSVTTSNIDTVLRFEGIEINNMFELSDSVLNKVTSFDSLIDTKKENKFVMLPIDFNVYYKRKLGKLAVDVSARYRLFTNYNPYVRIGAYYKLPIVTPGVTVAYGGYGSAQIGVNTELNFMKYLKIVLGTNNVLGAFAPKKSTALDAYTGVKLNF
jgi:hypothetical protein